MARTMKGTWVDWREIIFPELRNFETAQRERTLREAREEEFDTLEQAGILAAVVIASMIVGGLDLPAFAAGNRFVSTLFSFVIAVPLIALTAGVFFVRRTRRGLRKRLEKRRQPTPL